MTAFNPPSSRRIRLLRSARFTAFAVTVGLAAALPLFLRGPSCGHDFDFHLQSWLGVHSAWQSGLLDPHWVAAANYGAGEPRLVFYPPLTWLVGALLGFLLPWTWVPAAFTAVCFAGAAAAMHRLASSFCAPTPALVASVLYALGPYLLFTGYERTAYGEFAAATWMPLLLLALLRPPLSLLRVALLVATLWYTNAPAAVMGCYLVLLALVWHVGTALLNLRALQRLHPRQTYLSMGIFRALAFSSLQGGAALLLGGALAADYLIPATYEQRFVSIDRAVSPGLRIQDSFLFGHTGESFHDQVLATASWIVIWVAALAAWPAMLAASRWFLRTRAVGRTNLQPISTNDPERALALLAFVFAVCLLLQLPPALILWHALPELSFLQFPWRLLLPASAAAALLVASAFPLLRHRGRLAVLGLTAVYAIGAVAWASQTRYQPCDEEDRVSAQLELLRAGTGFEGTDEYAAARSDNGEIQQGLPRVRLLAAPDADEGDDSGPSDAAANPQWKAPAHGIAGGQVEIIRWRPEAVAIRVYAPHADYAVLRLEQFPAWRVSLNGFPCGTACVAREDGLVTVHLPPGRWSEIDARYTTTEDVWAGRLTSCAALTLLSVLALRRRS